MPAHSMTGWTPLISRWMRGDRRLPDLLKARLATPVVVCLADMATGKNVNVQSLAQDEPALLIAAGLAMRHLNQTA